jgi:hypothetical protein
MIGRKREGNHWANLNAIVDRPQPPACAPILPIARIALSGGLMTARNCMYAKHAKIGNRESASLYIIQFQLYYHARVSARAINCAG